MPTIIFSHGKDSEPWGQKILAMAEVAKRHGLRVESVDYRGIDDPTGRVQKLLEFCKSVPGELLLVGSSLGGHVAATVSAHVPVRGMFLLAPAFYMPGYERYTPVPAECPIAIVHGWNDDIVPVENSIRFAKTYASELHVLDSDHRLTANIADICALLDQFLQRVLGTKRIADSG
jgi:pimeloyl-ACP methyl ester carboxylesterase